MRGGVLCYSLWSLIALWQGCCMVPTSALLLCTVVGDLLLHYHLALTRVLRFAHFLNPCVPPLPVFGTLCLTEWPTLHSSLLGSTAKVFCPFCPVLAYYALGRTLAGMSACKPCCPGWCLLRAHCSSGFPGTATCVPAPTEPSRASLGSVLLDCVTPRPLSYLGLT